MKTINKPALVEIGGRIREKRKALGMSQEDLALRSGFKSRTSINKIELGQRDIPQSVIKRIADALGTTPSYIMGWPSSGLAKISESSAKVPLLGGAACGVGSSMAILEDIEKPDFIDADCAFQCRGESMASQGIHDNDVVYVKTGIYSDGVIHCVRIEDSYVLKKLYRSQNGFLLTSDIDPITVSGEQEDYEIVGKAVYILHAV